MSYQTILHEVRDGVSVLTLNRPESLNSFNTLMHEEVREIIAQVRDSLSIRCLLITGAGRGFCAGQDLGDRAVAADDSVPDLGGSVEKNYNPLIRNIMTMEKPVICAVNGVAAGAGASLALACDIVLAARSAKFVQAFSKIGVVPDSGCSWNLPKALGLPRAKALALLGEKLSAEKAEQWGMIWQCIDDELLHEEALKMAVYFSTQPTKALGRIKTLLNQSFANPLHHQLELEKESMREMGRTEDYREGVGAFMEKRTPSFTGN